VSHSPSYPRPLDSRDLAWLDYLLPLDRPGYALLRRQLDGLLVLGEGRWGQGDLMIGNPAAEIDTTAPMLPVAAFGEILVATPDGTEQTIVLSLHQPDEEGLIEFQRTTLSGVPLPAEFVETGRWCHSYWNPGDPCPATGKPVRQVDLSRDGALQLVLSTGRRVLWVFDSLTMMNTLVPVTNFYNELMLLKGIRDAAIVLDHRRLFDAMDEFTDNELRDAFARYNKVFRKVEQDRLLQMSVEQSTPPERPGLVARMMRMFGGSN
jgi:hypothetical protein